MAKGQSIIGSLDDLCAEHGCPPGVNRFTWLDYMLGKLAKLEAERDALRADAARYRWLRDNATSVKGSGGKFDLPKYGVINFWWHKIQYVDGKPVILMEVDAAIDAKEPK